VVTCVCVIGMAGCVLLPLAVAGCRGPVVLWPVFHDAVVGAVGAGAAGAGPVPAEHLRGGPAVEFHQVALGATAVQPGVAEMVPEPVRPRVQAALAAPAGDHLVDPAGGHRPAVIDAQPQLLPPRLRVPGTGTEVAVHGAGGVVPDTDDPFPAALAAYPDRAVLQVNVAAPGVIRAAADPGDLPGPVARSTAITAASRRCANVRPAQVRSILARSWSPKTGTGLSGVIADGNQ